MLLSISAMIGKPIMLLYYCLRWLCHQIDLNLQFPENAREDPVISNRPRATADDSLDQMRERGNFFPLRNFEVRVFSGHVQDLCYHCSRFSVS